MRSCIELRLKEETEKLNVQVRKYEVVDVPVFSSYLFLRNYGHSHHRIYNLRFYRIHSLMDYRVWRRYCSDGLCEYNFDFEYLITNVTKITILISV